MSERMHVLAQQIFGKPTVAQCSLEEIQELVRRFPYFTPAQFLLLEKLKQEKDPGYPTQLQKAVLLYHNPLEFEYFISSDRFHTQSTMYEMEEADAVSEWREEVEADTLTEEGNPETATEKYEPAAEPEERIGEEQEEIRPGQEEVHELAVAEPIPAAEELAEEPTHLAEFIEAEPFGAPDITKEENTEAPVQEEAATAEDVPEIRLAAPDPVPEAAAPVLPENEKPAVTSEPLAFEPFHTVDYFASQGIRLSQEELPKDKFGRQLKSFTEWLKTMKRLPAAQVAASVDASSEKNVEHLAEDSIHDPNVVTEAMAEVWLKQGNKSKALEVYNKLSLHNPSKRAYFAALIENLKHS